MSAIQAGRDFVELEVESYTVPEKVSDTHTRNNAVTVEAQLLQLVLNELRGIREALEGRNR